MSKCAVCGVEAAARFGIPAGWIAVGDLNGVVVCSTDCASIVFSEQQREAAEAWASSAGR